jgi:hypothetical protein
MRMITTAGVAVICSAICAATTVALPAPGKPGSSVDPRGPEASVNPKMNPVATRNFDDGTPGEAITGGLFDSYGIPGFFPYGYGDPGTGTGGWVSGMALADG